MERRIINEDDLKEVTGGSIIISEDGTTCGRNCDDEYKVMDLNSIVKFAKENKNKMPEKKMMVEMEKLGYIVKL